MSIAVDAFLADGVTAVGGKLYALGAGWNRIVVPSLPARHDRIGVGLLVHLDDGTARQHRFAIRVETPAGTPLTLGASPTGPITAIEGSFGAGDGDDVTMPFAMQLDGLPLETAGRYAVVVTIDGDDVKTLAFHVVLQSSAETPAEAGRPSTGTAGYL
jgi:hypothetical protein